MQIRLLIFTLCLLLGCVTSFGSLEPCLDWIPQPFCESANSPKWAHTIASKAETLLRISEDHSIAFCLSTSNGISRFALTPDCKHGKIRLHRSIGANNDDTLSLLSFPTEALLPHTLLLPIRIEVIQGRLRVSSGAHTLYEQHVDSASKITELAYMGKEAFKWTIVME